MDNSYRIGEFLKLIANVCKSGIDIDSHSVYANLIYLDIEDKRKDISDNFDKWIEYFKSNKNIEVFVDPNWDYFCQFVSADVDRYFHNCNIKMYIPIDSQHIEMSAKYLFEFLANENITHLSKIGKCVRFDDIVIRTNNKENANKIIEFINSNKYIKEGLLKVNPFSVETDNISMAWDNTLSYNLVVSSWISNYIKWEYANNNLDNVSFLRFKMFVLEKSYSLFEKGEGLQDYLDNLMSDYVINDDSFAEIRDAKLFDYYSITKILLMSLNGIITKDKLFDFISVVSDKETQIGEIDKIKKLRLNVDADSKGFSDSQKNIFKNAFDYMVNLYGYGQTKENFLLFMDTGDYSYITRNNGTRELLYSSNIDKNIANLIVLDWRCEVLENAILTTYEKYGYSHAYNGLVNLVSNRDFSWFTNDNNSRINLIDRFSSDVDVLNLIRDRLFQLGYDPELLKNNICRIYFDKVINNEMNKRNTRN